MVAPRNLIPGETFSVYVHTEATNPASTQLISVSLDNSAGHTFADGGRRSINSGNKQFLCSKVVTVNYHCLGSFNKFFLMVCLCCLCRGQIRVTVTAWFRTDTTKC